MQFNDTTFAHKAKTQPGQPGGTGGKRLALAGLCCAALLLATACEKREDRLTAFDGFYFKAKTGPIDKKKTLADFSTTISNVSQSLEGARAAGRHEGTKYCIAKFGTSSVKWSVGPDTAPEHLRIVDDTLTFQGRCDP